MFLKNVLKFCSMSVVGRLAALLREIVFSATFGASAVGEAFLVAFRLPNLLRTFFADGAVYGSVIPELAEEKAKNGIQSVFKLATQIMAIGAIILFAITGIVELGAPFILKLVVPGFVNNPERWNYTLHATRILFPYLCFFSMATLFISMLNVMGRYWVHPIVGVILCAVACSAMYFIKDLPDATKLTYFCYAVLSSGFLMALCLFGICYYDGYRFTRPKLELSSRIKGILGRMTKTSIATFGLHVNVFIDMCLASYLPIGQLTYLAFADRINLLCVELFGTSMSTVLLPNFATIKDDPKKLFGMFEDAFIIALQITLPVSCLLFLCSDIFIKIFYGYGKFTTQNCYYCARALSCYAFGMPAYVLTRIFLSFFFAQNRNLVPIIATATTIAVNLTGNLILMKDYEYLGLAIATVCSMWVGVLIYMTVILHTFRAVSFSFSFDLLRSVLWATIFGLTSYLVCQYCQFNPDDTFQTNVTNLIALMVVSLGAYFYFGKQLRINRIGRTKVIS